jgi:hypothetical protein
MRASQTTTYKKRLRKSGLSPLARLVAATIADLRFEEGLDSREPLPLTMPALAEACGMKSKNTARRWLDEAIAAGWVIAASVYRDHRQQANQYFIVDPADHAEVNRLTSAIEGSGARLLRSSGRPISVKRLDTVVRSNNNGAADDAPHSGGGGSDEQGQPSTAGVASAATAPPALAGASATATAEPWTTTVIPSQTLRIVINREMHKRGVTAEHWKWLSDEDRQHLSALILGDWWTTDEARALRAQWEQQHDEPATEEELLDQMTGQHRDHAHGDYPRRRLDKPLHHRCPECHAPIGRACKQPSGYHPARRRLAEAQAQAG